MQKKVKTIKASKMLKNLEKLKHQSRDVLQFAHDIPIVKPQIISKPIASEMEIETIQIKEQLISAKWLITLQPTLTQDQDILYSDDTELHQIVKIQLSDKINKQKETQKKAYQMLLEDLKLQQKHQKWDEQVQENFQCQYNYISQGKVVTVDIKYYDYLKLSPHNYVNDTIINFFLKFIENEIVKNPLVLIYNTYFCAQLMNFDKDEKSLYQHYLKNSNERLLKWTKEDIMQKQYLIFPLHLKEHWAVIIVVNPLAICEYLVGKQGVNNGHILYFDSLLVLDNKISLLVKYYLLHFYNVQYKLLSNDKIFEIAQKAKTIQPIVPRQTNLVDCGLYLLEYVERFLLKPEKILNALDQDHINWFPKVIIFIKRIFIKRILVFLSQGQKDNADRYLSNCQQIDQYYAQLQEQYDNIDESLLEQLQIPRLQYYLSEEYNYYYSNEYDCFR